ncbi:hypothetical protein DVK85_01620 [Flavobacterium arcticum]|uniref:Tox-MPTase4 domain-containing protein n=1 Tax=Flavobacterium arcticum TaxID=1784713 RepID=A0A345H8U1_9FLAO|nr:zincin-like metallopeptidase toxin domain-containing protein [Flavobacterium arcticum]AXG73001.1 hypothetical protein DVK85_01620 [Flavobacterium arcticum]KAF2510336.1 hypothetical protein E0W72_07590 [Flavobacterium arcticum]
MSNFDDIFSGENQSFFNSSSEFPSFESLGLGLSSNNPFEDTQGYRSIRETTNEHALNNSPFGKKSIFHSTVYTSKNIDFPKLIDFIEANRDAEFDARKFIGTITRRVVNPISVIADLIYPKFKEYIPIAGLPESSPDLTTKKTFETEIPLKINEGRFIEKELRLEGKLNEEIGIVNIRFDSEEDFTGRVEFKFNLDESIYYKLHFYYVGEERVKEDNNNGEIAFTISSSSFEDFQSMLKLCGYETPQKLYDIVRSTFINALEKISKESDVDGEYEDNHPKFRKLDWLYENMPAFVIVSLDFNQTIDNIFKLSYWDTRLPVGHDTTKAIINVLSKLNSEQVYNYFNATPGRLITLYRGFDNEGLITQFCLYLTFITIQYRYNSIQEVEKAIKNARVFEIKDEAHIETNILYGDEKGKVELTNEIDLSGLAFSGPVPNPSAISFLFNDVEINNNGNQSNQFHPLDLIYIKRYNPAIGATEAEPTIALYGKYLGDKAEWDDVKLAASITADVISIALSGGTLTAGAKGAARLFAIADITISTVNIATFLPAVRKELEKTEGGRWFLSYWPIISLCVSAGTISYYLAKGIVKYSNQLKQVKNNKFVEQIDELIDESRKVVDNIVGEGLYGGRVLSKVDLEDWAVFLKKKYRTNLQRVDSFDDPKVLAQFDPNTNTIKYKDDVTEYFMAHESFHAEEMYKLGFDEFVKDAALLGVRMEDYTPENWIRVYKREKYVYDKLIENSEKYNLNQEEMFHAFRYFDYIMYQLERRNIPISK